MKRLRFSYGNARVEKSTGCGTQTSVFPKCLTNLVPTGARLRIGEWWADRAANELGRAGESVRIEPKAMEVLMLLAEHGDRVVSREELLNAVWPGVVVGDEALTQSVIKLRRALGDDPRTPSYIETIPKRGYRLIAPVAKQRRHGVGPRRCGCSSTTAAGRRTLEPLAGLDSRHRFVLIVAGAYVFTRSQTSPVAAAGADVFDTGDGRRTDLLTVTVLPFETVGADAKEGYLARGISSDLVTDFPVSSGPARDQRVRRSSQQPDRTNRSLCRVG